MPTAQVTVDLALIKKYNVPGPRYTSYPPAVHFSSSYVPDIPAQILSNNASARELSLYFHLPFCQSLCWYCGCNNVIAREKGQSAVYLGYLEKEIDLLTRELNPERPVVQLHWGGGTPTFLTPDEIRRLGDLTRQRFHLSADVEASVEIDPRRFADGHIQALCDAGFNRVSIGVQDHDPEVQQAINRIQPREQTERVFQALRRAGFSSISMDLIYGLPKQTVESFSNTLDQVLALKPDRMAIFSYAHVPWIRPAQKLLEKAGLPSAETKFQLLKLSVEKLTENGYVCIGMDHFARADNDLAIAQSNGTLQRNFQGYSTRAGADVYGIGNSSVSQTEGAYWQNEKKLEDYYRGLDDGRLPFWTGYTMSADDKIRRQTIMRLMCDLELDYDAMSRRLGVDFPDYFSTELASLRDFEDDGLLEPTRRGMQVTSAGRLLVRVIAMRFDRFLTALPTDGMYSKTV